MIISKTLLAAALAVALVAPAQAEGWFVRAGIHTVNPRSDNGSLAGGTLEADIDSDTRPTLAFGRFLDEHWALELLAAAPFTHEVELNGATALEFDHLPPTLSVQYYFAEGSRVRPFLGAGVNYTWTYGEEETGPLEGTSTKVDNSWGLAAQAGVRFAMNDRWSIVADYRWMDIDNEVRVDGVNVGEVHVDPSVYGVYVDYRF